MGEQIIEELKVLRLERGETLVIQTDRILSLEQREWLGAAIKQAGLKAVVLDGGLKVAAVQAA